ncbi:MAG: RDD family protein [Patescibacteria group bacterium]|nr:RDD family protein [Patescibacteria group bacterium]
MTEETKSTQGAQVTQKPVAEDKNIVEESPTQPQEVVQTPISDIRYSGFWVRGAGYIIDGFIVGLLVMIIGMPISVIVSMMTAFTGSSILATIGQLFSSLIGLAIAWGYFIFMTHKYQATLGKMAIGVKVVADDGVGKLTLGKVTLRETVGKFVSSLVFGIGYIVAAFTKKKQGLHDFIASSTVIYKNPRKGPNTVAVVLAYVAWVFMMFIAIVIMVIFFAIISATLFGLFSAAEETPELFGGIESIMQEGSEYDNYDTDFDSMPNMQFDIDGMEIEIGDEELDALQDVLQSLEGDDVINTL